MNSLLKRTTQGLCLSGMAWMPLAFCGGCAEWHDWALAQSQFRAQRDAQKSKVAAQPEVDETHAIVSTEGELSAEGDVVPVDVLEARIQEYLERYEQRRRQPDQNQTAFTQLAAADTSVSEFDRILTERLGVSSPERQPVGVPMPNGLEQLPESRPRSSMQIPADTDNAAVAVNRPSAAPEPVRVQEPPTLLSVSVEPDFLRGERNSPTVGREQQSSPNTGAEVSVVTSPNDIMTMIERLEAQVARDPNDLEAQIRLKLLYIVTGEESKAQSAPEGLASLTAGLFQSLANTIIQLQLASADLAGGAGTALAATVSLADSLREHAQLEIPSLVLCRRVDSFGTYEPIDPPSFAGGSPVSAVVYTELDNLSSETDDAGMYRTRLSQRIELLGESGERIWSRDDQNLEDLCRRPRRDFFLAPIVHLPDGLAPGTYHLRIEVQDQVSGKFTSASTPLLILGSAGPS